MKKHRWIIPYLCLCATLLLLLRWSLQEVPVPSASIPSSTIPTETLTLDQFHSLLARQPLVVTSSAYIVRDEKYKALFPDMLRAVMENHTEEELTDVAIAFAAWDIYGAPVAIEGKRDFANGTYIRVVNYTDIALAPGGTYGEDMGYPVEDGRGIQRVEAVAVSFTTASGETWENPYYPQWAAFYEGKSYPETGAVEVPLLDETKKAGSQAPGLLLCFIPSQRNPCPVRRWGTPNPRAHPPKGCRGRCRYPDRRPRDHTHSRKGIHTCPLLTSFLNWE